MKRHAICILIIVILCLSGCAKMKSVPTIDLAAEVGADEFITSPTTVHSLLATTETTVLEPSESPATIPSEAPTVFVSTPESTVFLPIPETTVYVSSPESTTFVSTVEEIPAVLAQTPEPSVAEMQAEPATAAPATVGTPVTEAPPASAAHTSPADEDATAQDYVLNKNSKKFHYPTCGSVSQMKPSNREDVHAARDELISQGYSPCGRCKP